MSLFHLHLTPVPIYSTSSAYSSYRKNLAPARTRLVIVYLSLADSNKRISEVLEEEFEDGGCLADYDKNEVTTNDAAASGDV